MSDFQLSKINIAKPSYDKLNFINKEKVNIPIETVEISSIDVETIAQKVSTNTSLIVDQTAIQEFYKIVIGIMILDIVCPYLGGAAIFGGYLVGDHAFDIGGETEESLKMIVNDFEELYQKLQKGTAESDDFVLFGKTFISALANILEDFWSVDACSTVVVGGNSILAGIEKFGKGLISDIAPFRKTSEEEATYLSELKIKISSSLNYNLTEDDSNALINYYCSNQEKIDITELKLLINYFENKNNSNIKEYQEILTILNNIENKNLSAEETQIEFAKIFRLNYQSNVDELKYYFYENNSIGNFINNNSYIDFENPIFTKSEETTEEVLIYGTHILYNVVLGFVGGVIPFADLIVKPTEYKEGKYFSDEIGETNFNNISKASFGGGQVAGFLAGIGLDVATGFLTAGTTTAASAASKTAKTLNSTSKVLNAVDDVSDTSKALKMIDKSVDAVNASKKSLKTLDAVSDAIDNLDDASKAAKALGKLDDIADTADSLDDTLKSLKKALETAKNPEMIEEALQALSKAKNGLKNFDKLNDVIEAASDLEKIAKKFKIAAKAAKSLNDFANFSSLTKYIDNFVNVLKYGDALEVDKIKNCTKILDLITKKLKKFSATFDVNNLVDDVEILKVKNSTTGSQKYKFDINLDDVPIANREAYKEMFNNLSDSIKMDKNIGESLEKIFDTDKYVIGIHKAGISNPEDILKEGLRLTGDSSSGVAFNGIDLNNNIVFEQISGAKDLDFLRFCKNIEGSAGYKTLTGEGNAIIVKIPKADFDNISKLTFFDGTNYVLKPEYIAGYVSTSMDEIGDVTFKNLVTSKKLNNVQDFIEEFKHKKNNNLYKSFMNNKQIDEYFGELEDDIANLISQKIEYPDGSFEFEVKTADEVMNILDESKKIKFQEYLDNTIQGQYYQKLTSDEIKALRIYTYKGDKVINSALRNGTADKDRVAIIEKACNMKFKDIVYNLDSAIKKYGGLDENMVIYRGINENAILKIAGIENEYWENMNKLNIDPEDSWDYLYASLKAFEGKEKSLVDDAFLSTSLNSQVEWVKYNPIVLKIQASEGTNGAYIDLFSHFRKIISEKEFLLVPNQKLKIISVGKQWINDAEKIIVNCVIK